MTPRDTLYGEPKLAKSVLARAALTQPPGQSHVPFSEVNDTLLIEMSGGGSRAW